MCETPRIPMRERADQLTEWFDSSATASQCRTRLADIVRGLEGLLTPVWHPLGFIHVKLADIPDGGTYRLHLWSAEHRNSREQPDKIHDHLFNVTSRVVAGSIENIHYRFVAGESEDYREFRVDYQSDYSRLIATGVVGRLHVIDRKRIKPPGKYLVPRCELHETLFPDDGLALTVIRTSEPLNYKPRAILRRATAAPPDRTRLGCSTELWRRLLAQLIPL